MKRTLLAVIGLGVLVGTPLRAQETQAGGEAEEEKTLTFTDAVVVSGSKIEERLIDSPATISVITSETIASNPGSNYGDLLRSVPGVNVVQTSARDINLSSRQATSTLTNSQLTLLDGRSIYLDFFGMVLWDFVPSSSAEIKQIEVVRGPASAVWGANALTGVVNIITKPPRDVTGNWITLSGGLFDRSCDRCSRSDTGYNYGFGLTTSQAPWEHWAYRMSAGYFNSDPFSRPTGTIPRAQDPRAPGQFVGGAAYPADRSGQLGAFQNDGTAQPKFDIRIDNDRDDGSRITLAGGYAGTEGIVHTGIGPFDIQQGSNMWYSKLAFNKGGFKASAFGNFVDADAPNLLLIDPLTGRPLQLNFKTATYDFELGYTKVLGGKHILSMGGNGRRNNFDITIAPQSEDRSEFGAYFQDEIFFDRFRFALGARVDKFGNIDDPVFSPRVSAMFKPRPDHSFRVSFNKAFRSPSTINNFLNISIVQPVDLRGLAAFLPPILRPAVATPFPLVVRAVGSDVTIPGKTRPALKEESLTAYEIGYTGTFNKRTTVGVSAYINDTNDNINFTPLPNNFDPYTATSPPPGWTARRLPASLIAVLGLLPRQLGGPIFFPRTAFTYQNLGPLRNKGVEVSLDHYFSEKVSGFVNYSWQDKPKVLDPDSGQQAYPTDEIALPPTSRVNAGVNVNTERFLGSVSLNYQGEAFWSDVLTSQFFGFTDSFTLVNASFGVKFWTDKLTTAIKATNILNQDVQQHVFGDILKRSVTLEVRIRY